MYKVFRQRMLSVQLRHHSAVFRLPNGQFWRLFFLYVLKLTQPS